MGASGEPTDGERVVHNRTDEMFKQQDSIPVGQTAPPLRRFPNTLSLCALSFSPDRCESTRWRSTWLDTQWWLVLLWILYLGHWGGGEVVWRDVWCVCHVNPTEIFIGATTQETAPYCDQPRIPIHVLGLFLVRLCSVSHCQPLSLIFNSSMCTFYNEFKDIFRLELLWVNWIMVAVIRSKLSWKFRGWGAFLWHWLRVSNFVHLKIIMYLL